MKAPKVYCAFDEMVATAELKANPRNPNQHAADQVALLAKIIKSQGWRAPITVSKRSGQIVRGHGRLMAAIKLCLEDCPVDYQDYKSEAEEYADLIADNRIAELSDADDNLLAALLADVEESDTDLNLTGYTEDEYEELTRALTAKDETITGNQEYSAGDFETKGTNVECPRCGLRFDA